MGVRLLFFFISKRETGTEVNPESWTQLKGSNETYI